MPRIPDEALHGAVFLYETIDGAREGSECGGTGFVVGVPSEQFPQHLLYTYVVSNWHVAVDSGASIIRLNLKDGGVDVFEHEPSEWTFKPGVDVAAIPANIGDSHQVTVAPAGLLLTREMATSINIGPGDDVFMIGRFIDHDGGSTNKPAVRFGHISMAPGAIKNDMGWTVNSYCIDVHSRSGYSGSPVFAYRLFGTALGNAVLRDNKPIEASYNTFFCLLGIHWGQFPEIWELSQPEKLKESHEPLIKSGQYVKGLSGMTCVVPGWDILEVLNLPELQGQRKNADLYYDQKFRRDGLPPVPEVKSPVALPNLQSS